MNCLLSMENEKDRGIQISLNKPSVAIYDPCVLKKVRKELESFVTNWKAGNIGYTLANGSSVPYFQSVINRYAQNNQSPFRVKNGNWTVVIDLNAKPTISDPYGSFLTIFF